MYTCTVAYTGQVFFSRYRQHTAMFNWSPCSSISRTNLQGPANLKITLRVRAEQGTGKLILPNLFFFPSLQDIQSSNIDIFLYRKREKSYIHHKAIPQIHFNMVFDPLGVCQFPVSTSPLVLPTLLPPHPIDQFRLIWYLDVMRAI